MQEQRKGFAGVHHFPQQLTPFVDRTEELGAIRRLLVDPTCRLLTLIGSGGIGKTRLAIRVATVDASLAETFAHGLYFVALQPVRSASLLLSALAEAVAYSPHSQATLQVQLGNYLHDKQMLLVLDNFEQLLAAGAEERPQQAPGREAIAVLTELLQAAPGIKVLITSREALNVQEEWLYPLEGLAYPVVERAPGEVAAVVLCTEPLPKNPVMLGEEQEPQVVDAAYPAVQLFVNCARRLRPDFALATEVASVVRICQLVGGLPLAIELAASWVRMLDCAMIADEIQQGIAFLSTSLRNIPERHRNLRAVFDQSWRMLSDAERAVFQRLAIFRGSFRRTAAEQVGGATLSTLSALVNKSLLQWEANGRYQIHELLRQYAEEQLAQSPAEWAHTVEQHGAYFARFLAALTPALKGHGQLAATHDVESELDNLRAAWQCAVEQGRVDALQQMAQGLLAFYHCRNRYQEGANTFEQAVKRLAGQGPAREINLALMTVLVYEAWFLIHLRRLDEAEVALARSRDLQRALENPPLTGYLSDPALPEGILAYWRAHHTEVARLAEEALRNSIAWENPWNRQVACHLLSRAARLQGDYRQAQTYGTQALAVAQAVGDNWFLSFCHEELASTALALGEYTVANEHFAACHTLCKGTNHPEGVARALSGLADVALHRQAYTEAQQLYQQGLAGHQRVFSEGGIVYSLIGLGKVAIALGDYPTAGQYLQRALKVIRKMRSVRSGMQLLVNVGRLFLHTGRKERGLELLALVLRHPASSQSDRDETQALLAEWRPTIQNDRSAKNMQQVQADDLTLVMEALTAELALPDGSQDERQSPGHRRPTQPEQPLIEPLTPRELDVLQLVARGLTNQEVADELILSVGTVKFYTGQIYGKLGVNSRTQAIVHARELHILS